jgi:Leucine-rich repeat (LRR) protein
LASGNDSLTLKYFKMKKQVILVFALILSYSAAISQTPAITMTTKLPVGADFLFILEGSNELIQVDFGDGNKINYYISTSPFIGIPSFFSFPTPNIITGTISGTQTVKIYGIGITALICSGGWYQTYDSITGLDVSNCTTLKWLECSNNSLATVDVAKNIDLGIFVCGWNQLNTLDVSKNTALWYLNCNVNNISNLDVSKNILLKQFGCVTNKLNLLDVSKNTELLELECSNNQLTNLDVTKNISLTSLGCANNKLTSLDVSQNTVLRTLECSSNQLANLDVSKQTTALGVLSCASNKLTNLDVSQNTKMWKLYCFDNKLTNLDVSSNTLLMEINCSFNPLTSLDVSKDTILVSLNCNGGYLTSLYVSDNVSLTGLSCNHNQLTSLDVSKQTKVMNLDCSDNQLTNLDVSHNTDLMNLYCYNNQLTSLDVNANLIFLFCWDNQLTSLDVSKSKQLALLACYNNQLTFATLPLISTIYAPQSPILIEKALGTGEQVDLSSQLTVNGNTTVYTWKTKGGDILVQGIDYSLTDGKTVFFKSQADSVYCEMTNATFPLFSGNDVLKTTFSKVSINTGIDNINSPAVRIYTQNKTLYIVAPYNGQASVYDINGRLAMAKEITTGTNTIAMQKSGVYLVRLTVSNTPVIKKVFAGN